MPNQHREGPNNPAGSFYWQIRLNSKHQVSSVCYPDLHPFVWHLNLATRNLNLMGLPHHHVCEPVGLKATETARVASHGIRWKRQGHGKLARKTGMSFRGLVDQLGVWKASHKVWRAVWDRHGRNGEIYIGRNYWLACLKLTSFANIFCHEKISSFLLLVEKCSGHSSLLF